LKKLQPAIRKHENAADDDVEISVKNGQLTLAQVAVESVDVDSVARRKVNVQRAV
jgi:hypothetical protein